MSWPTVQLREVATIDRRIIEPQKIQPDCTYVGLENIESGGKLIQVRNVASGELSSSKFAFTEEHILYGKLRPYLAKIARPNFAGICSTDILPIRPSDQITRDYLTHYLRQPEIVEYASSQATGVNLPRLSPKILEQFEIPLPPLSEQQRIAAILDAAEALREKRRRGIERLDELVRSVFLEMFGDPLKNPCRWPVYRLGELISQGPQNGLYKHSSDYGTGTPILRIDGFYHGRVTDLAAMKRVRLSDQEKSLYGLRAGDLVINRVNSLEYLGKSALVPDLQEETVFESNIMRFSIVENIIDPLYLVQFLQTNFIRTQILGRAKNAVNQSSINQRDVTSLTVNLPPLKLQKEFAKRLTILREAESTFRVGLQQLNTLFTSLQQRAFRGEL